MDSHLALVYYLLLLLLFAYFLLFHANITSINELVTEINDESDYLSKWGKAPWSTQDHRQTTRFLFKCPQFNLPWGYIIYRTVYTAKNPKKEKKKKPGGPEPDPTPERLVKESRKHIIFSNKRFWDGTSIEQIRTHYAQYLRTSNGFNYGRFEGCLVIHERSLKSIVSSSSPHPRLGEAFVGMINGRYSDKTRHDPRYTGFMRVDFSCLWVLYIWLSLQSMRAVCPKDVPEGLIPVYDEGTGMAHDEEGNVVPVYLTEGRNRGRRLF
ncbi:hypothetical protein BJX63DRAFT_425692 [Aspergillus granulosus]|uniref:Uncharacterized protein n=1 Tax=Aspergillus granulosus TaxID=176169 RepID=A0ABR4GVP7_9EURO